MSKNKPISDADFQRMKSTLNNAIHELVFVCQHIGDDDLECAQNALMTAQESIGGVAEDLAKFEES